MSSWFARLQDSEPRKLPSHSFEDCPSANELWFRFERGQRSCLEAECLRVFSDNRSGEKARHVIDALAPETCVQLIALLGKSADATGAIFLINERRKIALDIISTAI